MLLDMADLIIYIDIAVCIRKRRILCRFVKQKFGLEKCNYKSTFSMLKNMYLWTDNLEKNKLEFEKKIYKYSYKLVGLDTVKKVKNYRWCLDGTKYYL